MPPENVLPLLLTMEIGLVPAGRVLVIAAQSSRMLRLVSCIGDAPHSAQGPFFFPVTLWGWRNEITFLRWC